MNILDLLFVSLTGDAGGGGDGGDGDGGGEGVGTGGESGQNLPVMPQWAANLPADITGTEAARNILMQHKNGDQKIEVPTTLVKSYIDSKRAVSGMVRIPAENATPADIQVFNKKIGVPDNPEGYKFKVPDKSPEGLFQDDMMKATAKDAHELGIPKAKMEALFDRFAGRQLETYNNIMAGNQQTVQERIDGLKTDLGSEFDVTVKVADKAVHFADPAMVDVFEKAGLIGHPVIVKGFAKIGKALGEGMLKGVDTGTPATTLTKEELEGMMRDPKYKLPEGDPVGKAWRKKVEAGFQALYPGAAGADTGPSSGRALHGGA